MQLTLELKSAWQRRRRIILAAAVFAIGAAAAGGLRAQNRADYEQFLFPVRTVYGYDLPSPGGFRRLSFLFGAFNPTDRTISYYPDGSACVFDPCIGAPRFEPGMNFGLPLGPGAGVGQFLYLARPEGSRVQFNVRLQDISSPEWGTEIPVIRENQYFNAPVHLLQLPLGAAFLTTVRIYDPDAVAPARFRIRVFDVSPGSQLLGEIEVTTRLYDDPSKRLPMFPLLPGYGEIADLRETVGVTAPTSRRRASRNVSDLDIGRIRIVRVEIVPITEGVRFWAFATVASTQVHSLKIVTPQ